MLQGYFHQSLGVGGVLGTHHDHQLHLRRDCLDGDLAVLGGIADVIARRILDIRELLTEHADGIHGLVHGQGGLGEPDQLGALGELQGVHIGLSIDQVDHVWGLARGAFHFLVSVVADQHDLVALTRKADDLMVHLGDQRAGGIQGIELQGASLLVHHRGNAMGGKHHVGAVGNFGGFIHEDHAALFKGGHHVLVVHDLLAHKQWRPVLFQGFFHSFDCAIHTGAITARCGQQNPLFRLAVLFVHGGLVCVSSGHVSHVNARAKCESGCHLGCPVLAAHTMNNCESSKFIPRPIFWPILCA